MYYVCCNIAIKICRLLIKNCYGTVAFFLPSLYAICYELTIKRNLWWQVYVYCRLWFLLACFLDHFYMFLIFNAIITLYISNIFYIIDFKGQIWHLFFNMCSVWFFFNWVNRIKLCLSVIFMCNSLILVVMRFLICWKLFYIV